MTIPSSASTRGNILIIDDVPENLIFLNKMLSAQGYKIRSAPSGHLAIQSVLAKLPDLILLDILMPEMDGYEVCQYLKANERSRNIPIIFVSALSETLDKVKAFSSGGSDYLTKPIEPLEAIARIEHQLSLSRLQRQLIERNKQLEHEIGSRKQAEEQVRLLQSVVVNANDGVVITEAEPIDQPGPRIIYVNESFTRMTGYRLEEVKGKTPRILQGVKTDVATCVKIRSALKSWQPIRAELLNYTKDGTEFWVDLNITPLIDENGRTTHWIAIQRDISDRKQREVDLQQITAALSHAVEGISRLDLQGQYRMVNQSYASTVGYQPEEMIGMEWPRTVHPDDLGKLMAAYEKMLSTGKVEVEAKGIRKDGSLFHKQVVMVATYDKQQQLTGHYCFMKDISERVRHEIMRKQAEAEILKSLAKERELNDLKTRFVSMVSHEYRTPLATMLSSLELLDHYGHRSTEQEKQEYFQQIRTAIQRMTTLLNDVLTLNKSETGNLICNPVPLDLKQFCQDLVSELQRNIKTEHNISLIVEDQCLQVQMDEKLLRHIFSNLILNAVKYWPQGGTIRFEVRCQDRAAIFCVEDRGIGIPSESIQNLFQPFFRAENVSNIAGTGLGLSIVKRLVEVQGGSISVESQVGSGTKFVVTIPL
ncbi:PAS domain S-box protein [Altericista sp. CCNU0014]|uniref:hybrid sensor histidine kinase/response regulator n=1 Tax=Altericista sp. CCNU0014 TaxID=3082949 RepID=UPI00384B7F09